MNIKGIIKERKPKPIEGQLEKKIQIVGKKEKNIKIKGILKLFSKGE